jgi:ferredoxin
VNFIFKNKDGSLAKVKCNEGKSILEVAHDNEIDLEGACESSLACSTCHVIL